MSNMSFAKGITVGLIAGTAIGMSCVPHRNRKMKGFTKKAFRSAGEVLENVVDSIFH